MPAAQPPRSALAPPGYPEASRSGEPSSPILSRALPAVVLAVVVVLEVLTGADAVILSLVVIAPLLASSWLPWRATFGYAVTAFALGAGLGAYSGQYATTTLNDQLARLTTIAAAGALAVGAARTRTMREERLARVLKIAAVAQRAILPPIPERLGPLRLAASYDSAQEEAAIGGDLYAAVLTPFGLRLLLADARGHGLDAVHLASTVLGAFRERAPERADLTALMGDLDRAVTRAGGEEDFATAVLAEVRAGSLHLVNAAHAAPLLLRAGVTIALEPAQPSLPLGLGAKARPVVLQLEIGDRLLLYTDGATEARRSTDGVFFPLERLAGPHLGTASLPAGLARLRSALSDWTQGALTDDVTLLAAEYDPDTDAHHGRDHTGDPQQG